MRVSVIGLLTAALALATAGSPGYGEQRAPAAAAAGGDTIAAPPRDDGGTPSRPPGIADPRNRDADRHGGGRDDVANQSGGGGQGDGDTAPTGPPGGQSASVDTRTDASSGAERPDDGKEEVFDGGGGSRGWYVCNRSDEPVVTIAISVLSGDAWEKSGWYSIRRGDCERVQGRLSNRYAYYFAAGGSRSWTGDSRFCADPRGQFSHQGEGCPAGYRPLGFKRVDFGGNVAFRLNLR